MKSEHTWREQTIIDNIYFHSNIISMYWKCENYEYFNNIDYPEQREQIVAEYLIYGGLI